MRFDLKVAYIFILALVLRLIFVWQWLRSPYGEVPYLDASAYDQWARAIADGNWIRGTAFYQSPLYPYLIAIVYKIFGSYPALISWLQAVMGAATCALIARSTTAQFGRRAGLAAGALAALDRALIFYSGPIVKESLGIFLLAWFVDLATRAHKSGRARLFFAAGVALGLAVLVRTNLLVLPVAVLAWEIGAKHRSIARNLLALSAGLAIVIAPVTLHNWLASDDFVLVNYAGGFNFYIGNSHSGARLDYPDDVSTDPTQEEKDTIRVAQDASGALLKPSEVSAYWFNKGWAFIVGQPLRAAATFGNKLWLFWSNIEIPDNYDMGFIAQNLSTLISLPLVGFGLLAGLAVCALVLGWRRQGHSAAKFQAALLLLYMISVLIFYVTARYRLPALVFVLPLAGHALALLWEDIQAKRSITVARTLAFLAPLLMVSFFSLTPRNSDTEAYNWGTLASLQSDTVEDQAAVTSMEKALAANPFKVESAAYVKGAASYERLGRLNESEELLRRNVEIHPQDGLAFLNYGRFKFEHGDSKAALDLYNRALMTMPWLHQPYIGLAAVYLQQGHPDLALEAVRRGLRVNPSSPQLRALLEQLGG